MIAVDLVEALEVAAAPFVVVARAGLIAVQMRELEARAESRVESIAVEMQEPAAQIESQVELIEAEKRELEARAESMEPGRRAVVESIEMIAQETPAIAVPVESIAVETPDLVAPFEVVVAVAEPVVEQIAAWETDLTRPHLFVLAALEIDLIDRRQAVFAAAMKAMIAAQELLAIL